MIQNLAPKSTALLVVAYDASLDGELTPSTRAIVRHLLSNEVSVAAVSLTPQGVAIVQDLFDESTGSNAGEHFINLGYLPPHPASLHAFVDGPISALDWYPTLLHLIGIQASKKPDGEDIFDVLLKAAPVPQRYLYFQYKKQKAIINGDWKYVRDVTAKEYLFNLAEDPSEQKNIASALQQATTRLRNELDSFIARMQQQYVQEG